MVYGGERVCIRKEKAASSYAVLQNSQEPWVAKSVYVGVGGGALKWYKEHLTNSFPIFAFFCVTLGNLLPSLSLVQVRRLDKLFSLLPSCSKTLWFS